MDILCTTVRGVVDYSLSCFVIIFRLVLCMNTSSRAIFNWNSTSSHTMSSIPISDATCNGVSPSVSRSFKSAPCSSSTEQLPGVPFAMRNVMPSIHGRPGPLHLRDAQEAPEKLKHVLRMTLAPVGYCCLHPERLSLHRDKGHNNS